MSADLATKRVAFEAALAALKDAAAVVLKTRTAYRCALLANSRLQPGDIIRNDQGDEAKIARLTIDTVDGDIGVAVVLRLKSGGWSSRVIAAGHGDWNHATLVARPTPEPAP